MEFNEPNEKYSFKYQSHIFPPEDTRRVTGQSGAPAALSGVCALWCHSDSQRVQGGGQYVQPGRAKKGIELHSQSFEKQLQWNSRDHHMRDLSI